LTAYERARRTSERNEVLQRLTASLSGAVTVEEVVSAVVRDAVVEIGARAALIALLSPSGEELTVTGEYGYDRSAVEPWTSFPVAAQLPMSEAVRERRPVVVEDLLERYPVFKTTVSEGDHTLVCLPMTVGHRAIGGISISFATVRTITNNDLAFLEAIAGQAGQALRRAMLYEERDHAAQSLQQSLLPRSLPDREGVRFAARYWAAGDTAEVGGDFYDVLETQHGLLALIGDVCGRGPEAASVMGMARYTAWGAAEREADPGRILETVNEVLLRNAGGDRFVTMAAVFVERHEAGLRVRAASAGHPPAVRIGTTIEPIPTRGMLLGVFDVPPIQSVATDVPLGEALLLYTDGVIERDGDHIPIEDDPVLARALLDASASDPDEVASAIELVLMGEGTLEDDAAILVVCASL
jgi:Stage II sporulation protein E (SpoIIE)/GAF domain